MASLRKHKKSKYWYACIKLPDGRQKQFSTGLESKPEAMAAAVAAEHAARGYTDAPHQLRAALDRLADELTPKTHTLPGPWLLRWAAAKRDTTAPSTWAAYQGTIRDVAAWLAAEKITTWPAITTARLVTLRDLWAETKSPVTVNSRVKHLRMALADATHDGLLTVNPAVKVPSLRESATSRREFRPAELDVLLPTLSGDWRAITLLGLYTGQRLGDLVDLHWRNVDLAAATITFTAKKTGALVALPIMPPALEALMALPSADAPDAPIFPAVRAISRPNRSAAFRKLLVEAGLVPFVKKNKGKRGATPDHSGRRTTAALSFHSLRHSATSMLKAAGVADSIARAIIGHESPAVSRSYTHFDMATMRREMARMLGGGGE